MQHQPKEINWPDIKEIQVVTSLDKYEKKIGRNVVEIYMDRDYTYAGDVGNLKRWQSTTGTNTLAQMNQS